MVNFSMQPFQTLYRGKQAEVVAYRTERVFCWLTILSENDLLYWSKSDHLDPVPPIPPVAMKPEIGEVWISESLGAFLLLRRDNNDEFWRVVSTDGLNCKWISSDRLSRIATTEETKPFRKILLGLENMFRGVK